MRHSIPRNSCVNSYFKKLCQDWVDKQEVLAGCVHKLPTISYSYYPKSLISVYIGLQ